MKYSAECPACSNEFEISGPDAAAAGLKCPKCDVGFIPPKICRTTTDEDIQQAENERRSAILLTDQRELELLQGNAESCFAIGMIAFLICIFCAIGAIMNDGNPVVFSVAGGFFSLGLIFIFLSQCLHIRAGLQKLFTKDRR